MRVFVVWSLWWPLESIPGNCLGKRLCDLSHETVSTLGNMANECYQILLRNPKGKVQVAPIFHHMAFKSLHHSFEEFITWQKLLHASFEQQRLPPPRLARSSVANSGRPTLNTGVFGHKNKQQVLFFFGGKPLMNIFVYFAARNLKSATR